MMLAGTLFFAQSEGRAEFHGDRPKFGTKIMGGGGGGALSHNYDAQNRPVYTLYNTLKKITLFTLCSLLG